MQDGEEEGPFGWWLAQMRKNYVDDAQKSLPRCSKGRWSHKEPQTILPLEAGSEFSGLSDDVRPTRPSLLAHPDDAAVFVGLAAYRDGVRCGATLFEAFTKAWNPARVVLGVVDQLSEGDPSCLAIYCGMMHEHGAKPELWARRANWETHMAGAARQGKEGKAQCLFAAQVRVSKQMASESKGPCLSRSQQADLIEPSDEFCMSMDAHMKLTPCVFAAPALFDTEPASIADSQTVRNVCYSSLTSHRADIGTDALSCSGCKPPTSMRYCRTTPRASSSSLST